MNDVRVWHPSRDPYHCAFRLLRLLSASDNPIPVERLRVLDMYLLYPSLLHRALIPREMKRQLNELEITKPDKLFVRLPSAAAVFQDLRLYQNSAITQLGAKGILDRTEIAKGNARLNWDACPRTLLEQALRKNKINEGLMGFLVGPFATMPLRGSDSIYRKAGLPLRAIAA